MDNSEAHGSGGEFDRRQIYDRLGISDCEAVKIEFHELIGRVVVIVCGDAYKLARQRIRAQDHGTGWDVEVLSPDEFDRKKKEATQRLRSIVDVDDHLVRLIVECGCLDFDELAVFNPEVLAQLGSLDTKQVGDIIAQAEVKALESGEC